MNKFAVIFGVILLSASTAVTADISIPDPTKESVGTPTAAVESVIIKPGDMLWNIARDMRPSEKYSVYQVIAALLDTNPDAFIRGNPNNLVAGATLKLDPTVLESIDRKKAFAQFQQATQKQLAAPAKQRLSPELVTTYQTEKQKSEQTAQQTTKPAAINQTDALTNIKRRIKAELQTEATSIKQTPIAGLYEVTVPPRVFYVSANGQYVLTGDLIDLKNSINLSEGVRDNARIASIENIGEENMIVFSPEKVKHTITVFTDIDCGYCRKLHNEMASYNKLGISIRYLAYPRAGIGSPSYNKAVSVWCSDDRKQAMTDSKNGKDLPPKNCENPVAKQMALGKGLGVNGTPAIVLANGQIYPGYAPADKLLQVIEQMSKGTTR